MYGFYVNMIKSAEMLHVHERCMDVCKRLCVLVYVGLSAEMFIEI